MIDVPKLTALPNFAALINEKFWYNQEREQLFYRKTGRAVKPTGCLRLVHINHDYRLPYDEIVFVCIHGYIRDASQLRSVGNTNLKAKWW